MLYAAVGQAEGLDAERVAARAMTQALSGLGGRKARVGIVFAGVEFDHARMLDTLLHLDPDIDLVGCTTAGEMSSAFGFSDDSVSIALLASEDLDIAVGLGRNLAGGPQRAVSEALAQARSRLRLPESLCLAFPDGFTVSPSDVLSAANGLLAGSCPLFGGTAAFQPGVFYPVRQFFGREVLADSIPLVLFGGRLTVSFSFSNGWKPLGRAEVVTLASGSEVFRIGDRTALEYYRHYLGPSTNPALELPLAVYELGKPRFCLRVPIDHNEKTGSVTFIGHIPEGAVVQVTEAVREPMLVDTRESVRIARNQYPDGRPALALVCSCGSRKEILGTQVEKEVHIVRDELPPGTPIIGFYGGGEFSPLESGASSSFHNSTMVTLLLGPGEDASLVSSPDLAASQHLDPARFDHQFLLHRLQRSELYRRRLEQIKELSTALLRSINQEVEEARRQIHLKNRELHALNQDLALEKQKSEELLLNILPEDVANELKRTGRVEPVYYESATVLFTDFKGFTQIAAQLSAAALIRELDYYFSAFDRVVERYNLEKLKTIGDAYMCAGGLPRTTSDHPIATVAAAWEMMEFINRAMEERRGSGLPLWELRIGIHTGPLMAGVIGSRKFAYDIWGDTVNIASRLESASVPGRINVSGSTRAAVGDAFDFHYRGKIAAKNKGEIDMYFVTGSLGSPHPDPTGTPSGSTFTP